MWHRIKARNDEKRVPNSLICRAIAYFLVLAFLFPFSSSLATGASANDLSLTDNVTITLDNFVEMLSARGKIPVADRYQFNIFLSPGASNIVSAIHGFTTTVSKRTEMLPTSGKLIIAGGVGKRILTISADIYDPDTQSWLTKGNFAIGRGRGFSASPFNSRVLVWVGMIVPF